MSTCSGYPSLYSQLCMLLVTNLPQPVLSQANKSHLDGVQAACWHFLYTNTNRRVKILIMGKFNKNQSKYFFVTGHEFLGIQFVYKTNFKRIPVTVKHRSYPTQIVKRLNRLDFKRITKTSQDGSSFRMISCTGNDLNGADTNAMLLRPRSSGDISVCKKYMEKEIGDNTGIDMRLINNSKLTTMWNTSIIEHNTTAACKQCLFI